MHAKRQCIVAGNWKMNGSLEDNHFLLDKLVAYREDKYQKANQHVKQPGLPPEPLMLDELVPTCVIFPPYVYLTQTSLCLNGTSIKWGAQNICHFANGAYTGEISGTMLKDLHCHYVLLGHSERRAVFGETNELIMQKLVMARKNNLMPILCIGETKEDHQAGRTEAVLTEQLSLMTDWQNCVIAYEPVWAIGTGDVATPDEAQKTHAWIRQYIQAKDPDIAATISIIYGGSVKPINAPALFAMPDIDGALVGGASLNADDFIAIVDAASGDIA